MPSPRRHRRPATWPALAAALAVHATLLLPLHGLGLFALGHGASIRSTPRPELAEAAVDLAVTCEGDVGLGAAARFALCVAPWAGELEPCLNDAATNLWMDLSGCSLGSDPGVAVAMLDPRAIDKLKAIDPEKLVAEPPPAPEAPKLVVLPQPAVPPPPPPAPPAPQRPTQVVETVKPSHEEDPQNARLLAEYSTKVEKEKVARGATKEPMVAKSKPEELAVVAKPKDEPAVEKPPEPDRPKGKDASAPDVPGTLAMRNPGAPVPAAEQQDPRSKGSPSGTRGPSIADGFMPRRGDGAVEQDRRERQEIPRGTNGGGGGGAPPSLKPSKEMLERIAGGGSVDHLDDVDNGDETGLNAMRWVHASFFNRLKRQVAQNWDPATVWHRVDPTGAVNGFKTRVTELRVALDAHGAVEKIVVTAPSGVGDLDDEAVRAFKASGPFPNAPAALAGKDGLITFAFSFYFEIGATHTSWRVIKGL